MITRQPTTLYYYAAYHACGCFHSRMPVGHTLTDTVLQLWHSEGFDVRVERCDEVSYAACKMHKGAR